MSDKKYDEFFYKKVQYETKDGIDHYWYLINKATRNGVHFHGFHYNEPQSGAFFSRADNHYNFMARGIEIHSAKPLYSPDDKPLPNCEVTGGDCWHDGTSLGASERLGHINPDGSDDDCIWRVLRGYYARFEEKDDE